MNRQPLQTSALPRGPRELRPAPVSIHRPRSASLALLHGAAIFVSGALRLILMRQLLAGACLLGTGATVAAAGLRGSVPVEVGALAAVTSASIAARGLAQARAGWKLDAAAHLILAGLLVAIQLRELAVDRRRPEAAFA